jgi:hypothetical protein
MPNRMHLIRWTSLALAALAACQSATKEKSKQLARETFPGPAGEDLLPEGGGDAVEVGTGLELAPLAQRLEAGEVRVELRARAVLLQDVLPETGGRSRGDRVEAPASVATVDDESDFLEEGEMGRDPALTHVQDLHQVGPRELLVREEVEDAQTGFVGQGLEETRGAGESNNRILIL